MDSEKLKQQQRPETADKDQTWASGFDGKGTASLPPPNNGLSSKSNPAQLQTSGDRQPPVSPSQVAQDAKAIYDCISGWFTDGADVVAVLRGKSVEHLRALRLYYKAAYGKVLEEHMESWLSATNYRAAMAYLFPALSLMDRLSIQLNTFDDNEEAMVWLIQNASVQERAVAQGQGIQEFLFEQLSDMQLYEAHKLVFPPAQFRPEHYRMAMKVIDQADNLFWDDDDHVYMVILDLDPQQRAALWNHRLSKLDFVSATKDQLRTLCLGTDVQRLATTMDLATDGAGTYDNLANKTVNYAQEKQARKAELDRKKAAGDESVNGELRQIGDINGLLAPRYADGELDENSFLGDLQGDLDASEFAAHQQTLQVSPYHQAKIKILNAMGANDDEQAIKDAFASVTDETTRRQLWADPQVQAALRSNLYWSEIEQLIPYREADSYRIAEDKLRTIADAFYYSDADYVKVIQLLMEICDEDRRQLVATQGDLIRKFNGGLLGEAVNRAAATGDVDLTLVLRAAGEGAGTSEELITAKLNKLNDQEYAALRLGYALESGFQVPESAVPQYMQQAARNRYRMVMDELGGEMGFDELNATTDLFLKAPSLTELQQPGGLDMSLFILQQRIRDKIATRDGGIEDGFIDFFSNSGGVADMAAMSALGQYHQATMDGTADDLDLAKMVAGYEQFDGAYLEHVAACDSVTDIASTVAAIAVAVVIVAATYGAAAPEAAVALSSYLGGTSAATVVGATVAAGGYKVGVSEAIGQEHFSVADEGARSFALGGVDGALTALTSGLAKGLQMAFFKSIGLEARLAGEMMVGEVLTASNHSLKLIGHDALAGFTRGTIDGIISGAIGNAVLTATDENAWRQGIWDTVSTFGMSMLAGVAMAGIGGGTMGALGGKMAVKGIGKLEDFAGRVGIDMDDLAKLAFERRRLVTDMNSLLAGGHIDDAEAALAKIQAEVGLDPAVRIRRHLYVANAQPMTESHIDLYVDQVIRRHGATHALTNQEWLDLKGFFHGDPACLQTFVARSDEEMVYALRSAREEMLDGGHALSRHGPDLTDGQLQHRVTGGMTPDGIPSPQSHSTRFNSYQEYWETRNFALQQISIGKSEQGVAVDLRFGPNVGGNTGRTRYQAVLDHPGQPNIAGGFEGVGSPSRISLTNPHSGRSRIQDVWPTTTRIHNPIYRTQTSIEWILDPAGGGHWAVKQHFPMGRGWDASLGRYATPPHNP